MRSDQQQAINRLAGTSATAFLCAVLCVYQQPYTQVQIEAIEA